MMLVKLSESDYFCGLQECYENIARKAGYLPKDISRYDCRHVNVSKNIQDAWYAYYKDQAKASNPDRAEADILREITMLLLLCGAKVQADLPDSAAWIEKGFYSEESDFEGRQET